MARKNRGALGMVLNPRQVRRMANARVDAETRAPMNSLAYQIANTQKQGAANQARAGAAYGRLTDPSSGLLASILSGQQASGATTQGNLRALQASNDASITRAGDAANATLAQDAASRGPGLDGGASAQLAQQLAGAHARATTEAQAGQTDAAAHSQSTADLLRSMMASAAMQGADAQTQIGNVAQQQANGFNQQRQDLIQKRGALRGQYTNDLNQQNFTNALSVETLLGKSASDQAAQTSKDAGFIAKYGKTPGEFATLRDPLGYMKSKHIGPYAAGSKVSPLEAAKFAADYGIPYKEFNGMSSADQLDYLRHNKLGPFKKKGAAGAGPTAKGLGIIDSVMQGLPTLVGQRNAQGKKITPNVAQYVFNKRFGPENVDLVAAAMRAIENGGYLTDADVQMLRGRGVKVPGRLRSPVRLATAVGAPR